VSVRDDSRLTRSDSGAVDREEAGLFGEFDHRDRFSLRWGGLTSVERGEISEPTTDFINFHRRGIDFCSPPPRDRSYGLARSSTGSPR